MLLVWLLAKSREHGTMDGVYDYILELVRSWYPVLLFPYIRHPPALVALWRDVIFTWQRVSVHTIALYPDTFLIHVHCLVLSRPFFMTLACWLLLKLHGFNAMFGHQFAKLCHHQHGICAEVIRHLRLHGNPSEINDLVSYVLIIGQYSPLHLYWCVVNN